MTRDEAASLLGAWVLDALGHDEAVAVAAAVAADADLRADAARLRAAVVALADDGGEAGDPNGEADGASVLAAALGRRANGRAAGLREPASPSAVLADRVAAAARTFAELADPAAWTRVVAPYRWSVLGLLGHLVAGEAETVEALGGPAADDLLVAAGLSPRGPGDHLERTQPVAHRAEQVGPDRAVAAWERLSAEVADLAVGRDPDERVRLEGLDVSVRSLLVLRGFELWTHAEDVRRAVGLPADDPDPAVLHTMCATSARVVERFAEVDRPATVRLVLTGYGGGAWDLALGGAAADPGTVPDADLLAGALDWCHHVAGRLDRAALDARIGGDEHLAAAALAAAPVLAQ